MNDQQFYKNLCALLVNEGFNRIPHSYADTESGEGFKHVGMIKQFGSVLYIAFICNLEEISIEKVNELSDSYRKRLESSLDKMNIRNVFILNILGYCESENGINEYVDSSEEFFGQDIITVNWAVNTDKGTVYNSSAQDFEILNLRKLIAKSTGDNPIKLNIGLKEKGQGFFVYVIFLINILIWALMELNGGSTNSNNLVDFGALDSYLTTARGEYFRLFTAIFLHIGFLHLAFNSLSLLIFGTRIERYYGKLNFLVIYLFSGFIGNVFSIFYGIQLSAGASGSIFGLLGAALAIAHKTRKSIGGLSFQFLLVFAIMSVGLGLVDTGINNIAHIGGLFSGYLAGFFLYRLPHKEHV